jgi:carbamoylphosphate synthase large subunit
MPFPAIVVIEFGLSVIKKSESKENFKNYFIKVGISGLSVALIIGTLICME